MGLKRLSFISFFLLSTVIIYGQKKFKIVVKETDSWRSIYCLVDENEKLIRQLDTAKYLMCFNPDQYVYFAVFGVKGNLNWVAIDADEKVLFNVYNTSFGEPTPDYLVEDKIRIVDSNNLIGFANHLGNVIIQPQFEIATSFHKGKAIIGQKCKKVPWDKHADESDCHHYSIVCESHGYIDESGVTHKVGNYSFEQIKKKIEWKAPDD